MNNPIQDIEKIELNELINRRKQKQLTVEAVADSMKVSKDFINYIENGEFEKLGAPTFVRGHVTNYCKAIGIDPGLVLAQMPGQILQHQQLKTSNAMGSSPLSHVRRQSNHFGRYAVGTALLGMLCMSFYFIWDKWSLPNDDQLNQSMSLSETNSDSSVNGQKKITYSSMIPQVSGTNYKTMAEPTDVDDLGSDDSVDQKDLGVEGESVDSSVESFETETNDEVEPLTLNDDNNSSAAANQVNAAYSIVMEFEEQAWVSIKTLDGENVVQDLMGPGRREIQVNEPVHFRIGNAQKAQLSINNDSVELAPLTNRDIADFQWPLEPNS